MKRVIFLLLALIYISAASGQESKQKVAIYIIDKSGFNIGAFAGDFLVNVIVKRGTYLAVERTVDFLNELNKEQGYQRTGSVDDGQISRLGKQFGVQLVCVVKVDKMGNWYFMSARLIDAETTGVSKTSQPHKFSSIDEIEKTCKAVTASLFSESEKSSKYNSAEPEMVFVQGGTFWMGCTHEQDSCYTIESIPQQVIVSDFYIGRYEVTQEQWKLLMDKDIRQQRDEADTKWPLLGEGYNYPIYYVSSQDAQEFISRLNAATGKSFRLPTNVEWEYAARGGSKSKGYKFSGSNLVESVGRLADNSDSEIQPVGTKQPNELGIFDMSGNVFEWCYDYSASAQSDPIDPSSGSYCVFRGGNWIYAASYCRVAYRYNHSPDSRSIILGFRLACSSK